MNTVTYDSLYFVFNPMGLYWGGGGGGLINGQNFASVTEGACFQGAGAFLEKAIFWNKLRYSRSGYDSYE